MFVHIYGLGACFHKLGYCGHFQLHMQFWPLHQTKNYLIQLVIVNHEDCHFKFQNSKFQMFFES